MLSYAKIIIYTLRYRIKISTYLLFSYSSFRTAIAAASLAIGTLNGEQET